MESEETNKHMDDDNHGKFCDFHSLSSLKAGDIVFGSLSDSVKSTLPSHSTVSEKTSSQMSWADMTQRDELEDEEQKESELDMQSVDASTLVGDLMKTPAKRKLSREERERFRFMNVKKMKVFSCFEKVNGKLVNIVEGLELHTGVVSAVEQNRIIEHVYELQEKGRKGELRERTLTVPQKWMRGKRRVTIQFGCCYNYATDKAGNPPGILQQEDVDPISSLFKIMIRRLIAWHVLPQSCVPDSCIVNIYDEGDCIPPHIYHHDFLRPFCTISFFSECNILFGTNLKIVGPGDFSGSCSIPLLVGSVLVLKGNGADVAKHCVPAVHTKRISITFRKMDESKRPVGFTPDLDLHGIKPLPYEHTTLSTPVVTDINSSVSNNDHNSSTRAAHTERSKHRNYRSESRE